MVIPYPSVLALPLNALRGRSSARDTMSVLCGGYPIVDGMFVPPWEFIEIS